MAKTSTFLDRILKAGSGNTLDKGVFRSEPSGFISTGIPELDHFGLSCGGLPLARFSEIFGTEGSGKSSLVYSCLKQVQVMGGIPVLLHTEEAGQKSRLVDEVG